jgi:hypothetical protein
VTFEIRTAGSDMYEDGGALRGESREPRAEVL